MLDNLLFYSALSFTAAFAITLYFVWHKPRPLWILLALAVVLSILFDWRFALPGLFLGLGAKVLLSKGKSAWK